MTGAWFQRSPVKCARILAVLLAGALIGCGATPPTAPDARAVDPPADTAAPSDTRMGTFTGFPSYEGAGVVRVWMVGDTTVIDFGPDFRSTEVPGPYVYLNTVPDVNEGNALRIAALRSPTGPQRYAAVLPGNYTFSYVVVWCDPFNVGVAMAELDS